jgi:hypothetical protein
MSITVIERDSERGVYERWQDAMVIDHPEHGRLLLVEGFGGTDSLRGGAYRWEHGAVCRLRPDDTLDGLRAGAWNEQVTLLGAVLAGHDESRPVLEWRGDEIQAIVDQIEIRAWVERHGGNRSALARRLGIGRTHLQALLSGSERPSRQLLAHMDTIDRVAELEAQR